MTNSLVEFNKRQAADADARHREIALMHAEGKTMAEIGALLNLSKGRISQIIKRARERDLLPSR